MRIPAKMWKRILWIGGGVVLAGILLVVSLNLLVCLSADDRILSPDEAAELSDMDCIMVLGCYVHEDGIPSDMLRDRLRRGVALYKDGASPKLLMSGDHGQTEYDEVNTMKQYAIDNGVPSTDVFMDHAGFSTYESVYRAKEIFGVKKMIIVTQEYHLSRALYIAEELGIEAYGVSADYLPYAGQFSRDVREVMARTKDVFTTLFEPEPTYLGEAIPVGGNGDVTNDKATVAK